MTVVWVVHIGVHLAHVVDVTGFVGDRPTCMWVRANLHVAHVGGSATRNEERATRIDAGDGWRRWCEAVVRRRNTAMQKMPERPERRGIICAGLVRRCRVVPHEFGGPVSSHGRSLGPGWPASFDFAFRTGFLAGHDQMRGRGTETGAVPRRTQTARECAPTGRREVRGSNGDTSHSDFPIRGVYRRLPRVWRTLSRQFERHWNCARRNR